ncbi:unnamed protein product [Rangifer tarandus platyrhynchus]|uniref:Uncharacterized protein n=1 Tax=Rangifer tarandus platyrhynchus TaxID=3082113 RepID=A0ABN9A083_RANTA|nr:unnamed protein product [Rangifer tarandus platyrhynchus]
MSSTGHLERHRTCGKADNTYFFSHWKTATDQTKGKLLMLEVPNRVVWFLLCLNDLVAVHPDIWSISRRQMRQGAQLAVNGTRQRVFTSFHSLRVTKLGDVDDPQTLSPHHTDEIIEAQISVSKEQPGLAPRLIPSSQPETVNCQLQAASSPALIGRISGGHAGAARQLQTRPWLC